MNPRDRKFYEEVYDLLVREGGAVDRYREDFLSYFGENHSYYEWKFGGKLGSGGKFRSVTGGKFRVSSYPDSAGEREREALEKRLNDEIEAIRLRHAGA